MNKLRSPQRHGIINSRLDIHYYLPILKGAFEQNAPFFVDFADLCLSALNKLTAIGAGVD